MTRSVQTPRPLVSVVIPCYNQAHFLGEAIQSVLDQRYQHVEIIVIDDGSTDETSAVASTFPEVRLVRQENRGLSGARNRGIEVSTGQLLVFLDADDRLLPEALQAGVACISDHPHAAFAFGQFQFISSDGLRMRELRRAPVSEDAYLELLRTNRISMHATVMYRRWVFQRVGFFSTALGACEDYEMYLRITRRYPVVEHPAMVAEYRRHDESMSNDGRRMIESALAVLDAELPHVRREPRLRAAYQEGRRRVSGYYTLRIVRCVLSPRAGWDNWSRACSDLWWLARAHPGAFVHTRLWLPELVVRRTINRSEYASA